MSKYLAKTKLKGTGNAEAQTAAIRSQLINDLIVRTLLTEEIEHKRIVVATKDVDAEMKKIKASIPAGESLDDYLRKADTTNELLRKEVIIKLKGDKLVRGYAQKQDAPTSKEVETFYQNNKNRFLIPKTVHVRQILIAAATSDSAEDRRIKMLGAEKNTKRVVKWCRV